MFERKTETITFENCDFVVWVNPPRGAMEEAGKKGNSCFLEYLLENWSLGGQEYEGYTFPDKPTVEACDNLPIDIQEGLALAVGEAIRNQIPKPKKRR